MARTRTSCIIGAALLVGGVMLAGPAPASAQSTSFGIWGGLYTPLGKDVDLGGVSGTVQRNNSFAGGARLTFWGSTVLGLELEAGLTPASVDVAGGTINGSRNLNVFAGGAKIMLGLSPSTSAVGVHVGAGPAVIRRGSDVSSESSSETNFGVVVGGGIRLPFSHAVSLRLDAEDYIYKGDFGGNNDTRNDLILSTGLSFGL